MVGIATGKLPKLAWLDYLQQDTFYLRLERRALFTFSIYEKAYVRVIEMCKERGDDFHRKICEDICAVVRRELNSHVQKTNESKEDVKEFKMKKATRDYTDLVIKAYTEGSLSEIVTPVCPCNKLSVHLSSLMLGTSFLVTRLPPFSQTTTTPTATGFASMPATNSLYPFFSSASVACF